MNMNAPLQNRHIVITGAARGIGAAIAHTLAKAGAKLTLLGRHADTLQTLAQQLGTETHIEAVDISVEAQVQQAVANAVKQLGPVHVLVNNAGQASSQPIEKTDLALWQHMLNVNLTGTYLCTQAVLPSMKEAAAQGVAGRIINIASTAGLKGYAYVSAYTAAKHGVVGFTRALALELASKNITVNALCPGYTETDIVKDALTFIVHKTGKTESEARARMTARNPQQRMVQPAEVANAVLWLCSPGSEAINGQAIAIDGGELAG
jgi:NAD(P)-dependent dehydrogenase (short-subunit alcohol dehydrogenase family)